MTLSNDTQWPRFEVFLQDREGAAHQDVGSVHAPDIDLALMNARDVFVRRPQCTSLWVVPAEDITARTHQELAAESMDEALPEVEEQICYDVFAKHKPAGTHVWAGEVLASTPGFAIRKALSQLEGLKKAQVIWVCRADAVHKSTEAEAESLFSQADDKPFRMATDFHTVTAMRRIRKED
jgi:ring-1,2-phenylacetyl-CoA epoxidase subunit PaaB